MVARARDHPSNTTVYVNLVFSKVFGNLAKTKPNLYSLYNYFSKSKFHKFPNVSELEISCMVTFDWSRFMAFMSLGAGAASFLASFMAFMSLGPGAADAIDFMAFIALGVGASELLDFVAFMAEGMVKGGVAKSARKMFVLKA